MIRGTVRPYESPSLRAVVYFPQPTERILEIDFLVDTGSSITVLALDDLSQLGDPSPLVTEPSESEVRLADGTPVHLASTRVGILFRHEDGRISSFGLSAGVLVDSKLRGVKSLLGMDILTHGPLTLNALANSVSFDPPAEDVIRV